jgi:hypothetical protein
MIAPAVARHRALAELRADPHVGHVAQEHRAAVRGAQDDLLDVRDVAQQPHAADVGLLPAVDDERARRVGVVGRQRRDHVAQRDAVLQQALRLGQHLELPHEAAEAVDLVDARDRPQPRRHQPVLHAAQLHRIESPAVQRVLVDLAQAGADRSQLRLDPLRQRLAHLRQPFEHHLPRPVDVRAVLEDHDDLAQLRLRQRTHLHHARDAAHPLLDRVRDARLHVRRRQPGRLGQHHHLHVRHVGEGVDRQVAPGHDARGECREDEQQDGAALAQEEGHPALHRSRLNPRSRRPSSSAARRT